MSDTDTNNTQSTMDTGEPVEALYMNER